LAGVAFAALLVQVPSVHKLTEISTHDVGRYEGEYGIPIDWSLSLIVAPAGRELPPLKKAIRTRGVLFATALKDGKAEARLCVEDTSQCLALDSPAPDIRDPFFFDAPTRNGDEAQVVGAFTSEGFLFWRFESGLRPERRPGLASAASRDGGSIRARAPTASSTSRSKGWSSTEARRSV
jgi:hypothetical protein